MSLGKGDISKEKLAEIQKQQTKIHIAKVPLERQPQKIITTACYGNRDGRLDSYANQHLLVTSPTVFGSPEIGTVMNHNLKAVKSQGALFNYDLCQNSSKLQAEKNKREVYLQPSHPLVQAHRNPSLEAGHLVKFNWNQAPNPNIHTFQQDHRVVSRPSKQDFSRLSIRSK